MVKHLYERDAKYLSLCKINANYVARYLCEINTR